jgi:hypothetical protein
MWEKFEILRKWFIAQPNRVKLGIIMSIGVILILIILLIFAQVLSNDSPLTGDALVKYEASCTVVSFQELNSNFNKYNGQHLKFTGQIVQINNNNGVTDILLSVTPLNDGSWSTSDFIFVTYKESTTFKVDDVVNVYGDVSGTYNFMSASLGDLTLTKLTARYIELVPDVTPTVVPVPFTSTITNTTNKTSNTSGPSNTVNPTNPITPSNNPNSSSQPPST